MSKALIEIFCLCFIEDGLLLCISCHSLLYLLVLRKVCEQEMLINGRLTICSAVELFVYDSDLRINIFFRTLGLRRPAISSMVGVLLILAFTSHVSYLTFVSFDYGYNMAANATIGKVL